MLWLVGFRPTCVRAGSILDPTEVPLHSDTHAVILLRKLKSCPWVIIIGLYLSGHTGVILKTALFSWKDSKVTCFYRKEKNLGVNLKYGMQSKLVVR
jgi:hypothetical protein